MDRNLEALLAVAETRNITAAADRLNITQPTLTKRLQQLEAAYSCELFQRLPRGVKLTRYGERLLPYFKRIEHEFLQSHEDLRSIKSGSLDELRVGAGPLFHLRYLGPAFERLKAEFPETMIRLAADVNLLNLPKLRDGRLDIAFGTTENLGPDDQISFRSLTMVEQGLVLRSDHPLASRTRIDVRSLGNISWIVYGETHENESMIHNYFKGQGLSAPNFVMQTNSFSLGLQMVAESDYVMTLPVQLEPILDTRKLSVIRTSPPIGRLAAGAYVRRSSQQYPVVNRLIEIVAQAADE